MYRVDETFRLIVLLEKKKIHFFVLLENSDNFPGIIYLDYQTLRDIKKDEDTRCLQHLVFSIFTVVIIFIILTRWRRAKTILK